MSGRPYEGRWTAALIDAWEIVQRLDLPASPAELAACVYPPRIAGSTAERAINEAAWTQARLELVRVLLARGWSEREIARTCHVDPKTIVAQRSTRC
jgi:DNA-binding NarL/FixJ family response regulator